MNEEGFIEPLESKWYSTVVHFPKFTVEIYGPCDSGPSSREIEEGWELDHGMDHVEPHDVYEAARVILKAFKNE